MDLEISDQGLDGLRQLYGTISPEISKKVIYNSVKQALTSKPYIPYKQELYAACPDRIKQAEYCILALFFQATRKGASVDDLRSYLLDRNFKNELVDELSITYKLHKNDFVQKAVAFAPNYLPFVSDVSWSLQCDVASSSLSKPGEISYKIQLEGNPPGGSVGGRNEVIADFVCNPEELQSLINQLKEIERSCRRVVSNNV